MDWRTYVNEDDKDFYKRFKQSYLKSKKELKYSYNLFKKSQEAKELPYIKTFEDYVVLELHKTGQV